MEEWNQDVKLVSTLKKTWKRTNEKNDKTRSKPNRRVKIKKFITVSSNIIKISKNYKIKLTYEIIVIKKLRINIKFILS